MEFVAAANHEQDALAFPAAGMRPPSTPARSSKTSSPKATNGSPSAEGDGSAFSKFGMSHDDHHDVGGSSPPAKHSALYDYLPRTQLSADAVEAESLRDAARAKQRARQWKQIPPKLVIEAPPVAVGGTAAPLRALSHALGVYQLVHPTGGYDAVPVAGQDATARTLDFQGGLKGQSKGPPAVWQHTREPLVLTQCTFDGQEGWAVALESTVGKRAAISGHVNRGDAEAPQGTADMKACVRIYGPDLPFQGRGRVAAWDGRAWRQSPEVVIRPTYHGWGAAVTSYIHNTVSTIPVDVRRPTVEGGGRLRSPTRYRSRVDKRQDGSPASVVPGMSEFKAKYSSPYGARATAPGRY
jgi:hypothetical protein